MVSLLTLRGIGTGSNPAEDSVKNADDLLTNPLVVVTNPAESVDKEVPYGFLVPHDEEDIHDIRTAAIDNDRRLTDGARRCARKLAEYTHIRDRDTREQIRVASAQVVDVIASKLRKAGA